MSKTFRDRGRRVTAQRILTHILNPKNKSYLRVWFYNCLGSRRVDDVPREGVKFIEENHEVLVSPEVVKSVVEEVLELPVLVREIEAVSQAESPNTISRMMERLFLNSPYPEEAVADQDGEEEKAAAAVIPTPSSGSDMNPL